MVFPVSHPYRITQGFSDAHLGIDIAPEVPGTVGIQCHAPENAMVLESSMLLPIEGNYIKLRGDSGMFYYFGHFQTRLVQARVRVVEGQPIGILGKTGEATNVHTHHEVRHTSSGDQVDPVVYYKSISTGEAMVTEGDVRNLYPPYLGRAAKDEDIKVWVGKPFGDFMYGIAESDEYKQRIADLAAGSNCTPDEREFLDLRKRI